MRHQEIAFNVSGQTVFFDAPEGAPTSPTVSVWRADADDDSTVETAITGSPSVESNPSTTVSAASGYGQADPTKVFLASLTGIARGRRYLMTNDTAETEWVEVVEVNSSGGYIRVRSPLQNAYPSSFTCTLKTTRITAMISPSWLADKTKISEWTRNQPGYRARFQYTVGSTVYVHHAYFDLTRYPLQHLVTPLDVDARFPGWIDRLPLDYREDQGAAFLQAAYDALRMDARGDGLLLRRLRETDVLHQLTVTRAMLCSVEAAVLAGAARADALETARDIYTQRYNQLIREPKVSTDEGGGGAATPAKRLSLWTK